MHANLLVQQIHGQLQSDGPHVVPLQGLGHVKVELQELVEAPSTASSSAVGVVAPLPALLLLHLVQQADEPLEGLLVAVDPEEVHLGEVAQRLAQVVGPAVVAVGTLPANLHVPEHDGLQHRREGSDPDPGGHQDGVLGLEEAGRGGAEGTLKLDLE